MKLVTGWGQIREKFGIRETDFIIRQPTGGKTMKFLGLDLADFSGQYLRAALTVSLMSVWMLVGLFYYLNHYTKRDYFTVWTAAWMFYALWLTPGLKFDDSPSD